MKKGIVKFYNSTKGYGFIKCEEDGKEYFVHATGCVDRIQDDAAVTFDLEENKKGLICVNVQLA